MALTIVETVEPTAKLQWRDGTLEYWCIIRTGRDVWGEWRQVPQVARPTLPSGDKPNAE